MCFISCLQFLTGRKAAFYRCRSDGELVGAVASFSGNNALPEGWLLCNGAAVSRETYAALFNIIGTTYGSGNDSTTFNLPNLADKFIQGNATAGTVKAAGLPNITGMGWNLMGKNATDWSGVFYVDGMGTYGLQSGTAIGGGNLHFNASRSSSVYGKSSTVQPPALTMKPFIYTGKTTLNKWLRTA